MLPAVHRNAAVATILLAHALAGWALLQVQAVREVVTAVSPVFVELLAASPASVVPAPSPAPPQRVQARPSPPTVPRPLISAAPSPTPSVLVAPAPEPSPPASQPVPVAVASPVAAPASMPAASAAAPRQIPPSAIQYLVLPDIAYPSASRRLNEQGLVVVAVFMDTEGLPQQVQIARSSGYERLDHAALVGVRRARFKPYTANGQALAGWARIPIPFELEH